MRPLGVTDRGDPLWDPLIDEDRPANPWRRAGTGNLWRRWLHMRLVVYRRRGRFCWLIDSGRGRVRFSPRGYRTEDAAVEAVWAEVEGTKPG
jgi:hypothetical protein